MTEQWLDLSGPLCFLQGMARRLATGQWPIHDCPITVPSSRRLLV